SGFVLGCKQTHCALIGGETAEMPDLYQPGEYDVAGTIVGIVDEDKIITGKTIAKGDILIGLASSGLHTNGYTLARRVLFDHSGLKVDSFIEDLSQTIGEALLAVHKCYLNSVSSLIEHRKIKGIAHITGGGIIGNLSRIIPPGLKIRIDWVSWPRPPIFELIQKLGNVPEDDMRRAFNLGIGMVLVVSPENADFVKAAVENAGETAWIMGAID
ncbi:MAG: phosphoribosylformylglycinamidine cyclo-ligase, partial [Calditrichaeota bacterium]|nr:phosphoribosylformylglycinamidine cyclo-ligase [Calditrichota bacterium]